MSVRFAFRRPDARPAPTARVRKAHRPVRDFPDDAWWRALQRAAESREADLRERFLAVVARFVRGADLAAVRRALERGDVDAVQRALPFDALREDLDDALRGELAAIVDAGGAQAARTLAAEMGVTLDFDLVNLRSVEYARGRAAVLAVQLSDETRDAIRRLMARSFLEGIPIPDIARRIAGPETRLGLTVRQATAVDNYEAFLRRLRTRDLADLSETTLARLRRAEPRFRTGATLRRGLSDERIASLVRGYRDRLLRERATNIARTEGIDAANHGQRRLWEEGVRSGQIRAEEFEKEYVAVIPSDGRTCPLCTALDGERAPIGGHYTDPTEGFALSGPPRHPRCRCAERLVRIDET